MVRQRSFCWFQRKLVQDQEVAGSKASCLSTSISLMSKSGSADPKRGANYRDTLPQATRRKLKIGQILLKAGYLLSFSQLVERSFMAISPATTRISKWASTT